MDRIDVPKTRRSQRTRVAVLDAAWALLEEHGAERTTLTAVAERAGVSRQALYLHFRSRGDLLIALHEHVDERLGLAASAGAVHDAVDAVAALDAFASHLARFHSQIMAIDLALLRARDDDADVAALVQQGTKAWLDACRSIAGRLADEGRLAGPWTADSAADLLWTFMFPETLHRLTVDRAWPVDQYGELLATLLQRTLVTH